jgi:hypothetical protein
MYNEFRSARPKGLSVPEILNGAADLLATKGHIRDDYKSAKGMCMVQAMYETATGDVRPVDTLSPQPNEVMDRAVEPAITQFLKFVYPKTTSYPFSKTAAVCQMNNDENYSTQDLIERLRAAAQHIKLAETLEV